MRHTPEELRQLIAPGTTYPLVFLRPGPTRDHSPEEQQALQWAHLDHLFSLKADGHLLMAGPTPASEALSGICLFASTVTMEQAKAFMLDDPSVKAGRLTVEVTPYFGLPGDGPK